MLCSIAENDQLRKSSWKTARPPRSEEEKSQDLSAWVGNLFRILADGQAEDINRFPAQWKADALLVDPDGDNTAEVREFYQSVSQYQDLGSGLHLGMKTFTPLQKNHIM